MHAGCAFYSQQAERQLGVLQNLCTNSNSMYVVLYLVNKSFHIIPKIKKKEMYCKVKKKQVACMVDGNKSNDEEARRRDACMKFRALHEVRRLRNIAFGIK
jgi:hypothetical protein